MDIENYSQSATHWAELFASAISGASGWQPWLNTDYENYMLGDDEIVIFSRYSPALKKGFSIQQRVQSSEGSPSVKAITRTALAESEDPITHLVICCSIDRVSDPLVKELLRLWCLSGARSMNCEVS